MPLVTISGGIGTGAGRIAHAVASKTGLEIYDDQRLLEEAIRMGIRQEELKGIKEKAPGFFDSLRYNSELYIDVLESVVYSVSRKGQGILVGHGSQILLRDFGCALHVLVHASEDYRIRQIAEDRKVSLESARKMLDKSDGEQRGFLRFAYHVDGEDASLYDLLVNTEKLGIEGAAEIIANTLRLDVIKECGLNALDAIERLMLMKRVKAAIQRAGLGLYSLSAIEIPEKGVVELAGVVETREEKTKTVNAVKEIPEVIKVKDEIAVLPHAGY